MTDCDFGCEVTLTKGVTLALCVDGVKRHTKNEMCLNTERLRILASF